MSLTRTKMRRGTRALSLLLAGTAMTTVMASPAAASPPTTDEIVQRALRAAPVNTTPPQADLQADVDPTTKTATVRLVEGVDISVTPLGSKSRSYVRQAGVQVLTVLDKGDKAKFKVDVPEGMSLVKDGAGFDLQAPGPEGAVTLAEIDAPWAVDAKGTRLPTTYTLNGGGILTQHIDTTGATYPIVADPSVVRRWFGWTVRFSVRETQTMALGASGVAVVAGTLPPPLNVWVGTIAGAVSVWAQWARHYGNCVAINFTWVGSYHPWYWNC